MKEAAIMYLSGYCDVAYEKNYNIVLVKWSGRTANAV